MTENTRPIILLDLNFTLVENSGSRFKHVKRGEFSLWIDRHERYRRWLVELLAGHHVILVTARHELYRDATLAAIASRCCGWQPDESHWNPAPRKLEPHKFKEIALKQEILPVHGLVEPGRYLALESNDLTRRMYKRHGVPSFEVPDKPGTWRALPRPDAEQTPLF